MAVLPRRRAGEGCSPGAYGVGCRSAGPNTSAPGTFRSGNESREKARTSEGLYSTGKDGLEKNPLISPVGSQES